ncbi:MAG: alpha-galactosidase [Deltaproteobacteria bacterium]|nr:alpha-galactosidase [Deltaproteobacteria bacterium]
MAARSRIAVVVFAALVATTLTLSGCGNDGDPTSPNPSPSRIELRPRADGRVDITERGQRVIVRGAWAEALIDAGSGKQLLSTRDCAADWEAGTTLPLRIPYFARTTGYRRSCASNGITLDWRIFGDASHDTAIVQLKVQNHTGSDIRVLRLTPLISEGGDGGLFLGDDPLRLRVLDNGSNVAIDVDAKLHYPDETRNLLIDQILPIASRGDVVSNWNTAVVDLDGGRSLIAGALTVERALPTIGTRSPKAAAPMLDGRAGLELVADNTLLFKGKVLASDEAVDSEWMYFAPLAPDAWTGLEDYADAVAAWQGITAWTKRGNGRRVPNGWNSWTGSGGTGGLGTNIDEQIMGENLDVMAREFAPFGVDYFQMDDGYQIAHGDWYPRTDRFPSGMLSWAQRVEQKGLIPGLWIGAFTVDESSSLFAAHPDWMARPRDNPLGPLLMPDAGQRVLDLSNAAVVDWLRDTMRRYRDDWHMGWIKLDFAYQAFPYAPPGSSLTAVEAYKRAIRSIHETLGDDVFYLGIGLIGMNYGVVDGMRLTLDNGPLWEEDNPFALIASGQNFKSTVRTGARRYYLHNRVWINHNDLLFFRTDSEHPEPRLTLDEATTFASFIGLSGSIVKFGEDLRTLTPEQIQIWRKLLPIYPATARPLDLFTRMYPEQWLLHIDHTLNGSPAAWHVLGLLNWGRNYDYSVNGAARVIADSERSFDVDLTSLGLARDRDYLAQEFWSEEFLGVVRGTLHRAVPPHGHAVIALRQASGHPQFLGDNRHFTQGATDLVEERWDAGARTLHLAFDLDQGAAAAVPFEYRFRVYVPDGYRLRSSAIGRGVVSQNGSVLTITTTPTASQRVAFDLGFE